MNFLTTDNILVNHKVNSYHPSNGSPTYGLPDCIMWPGVTFVNDVQTVKSRFNVPAFSDYFFMSRQ
jgi:hypothetical protein